MTDTICSLEGQARRTHLPPQTLFEEKLLTLLIAERARTLYYEYCVDAGEVASKFEDLAGERRDRWYGEARTLLHASL